jgi:ubiquitin C-terminal hydrolase
LRNNGVELHKSYFTYFILLSFPLGEGKHFAFAIKVSGDSYCRGQLFSTDQKNRCSKRNRKIAVSESLDSQQKMQFFIDHL